MTDYRLILMTTTDGRMEIRYRDENSNHWQTIDVDPSLCVEQVVSSLVEVLKPNNVTRKLAGAL